MDNGEFERSLIDCGVGFCQSVSMVFSKTT